MGKAKQSGLGLEVILPDWIDKEAWDGWVAMRIEDKSPLTERATKIALKALWEMKKQGQDPNKSLEQSEFHRWTALFAPQGMFAPSGTPARANRFPTPDERQRAETEAAKRELKGI